MKSSENTSSERKPPKNRSIYIRAKRGMYGLPQAGLLANKLLEKCPNKQGYQQSKLVPGLWKHNTRRIQFTLVVNDFGVKYVGKNHAQHLKNTLEEHYILRCNWTGKRYIRITLDWDYNKRHVHLHAKLCAKSFETISTQSWKTAACAMPKCTNTIWCKETIHNTGIKDVTVRQQSQAVHSTGMQQVFIPWQSS